MVPRKTILFAILCLAGICAMLTALHAPVRAGGPQKVERSALAMPFDRGYGQVEVGGPYAGVEFHDSRPLPSRVSFYAPVANSIDLSTDYWKRGDSRPFVLAMKLDGGSLVVLGKDAWDYVVGPHRVEFTGLRSGIAFRLSYDFSRKLPFFALRIVALNRSGAPHRLELYTHARLALRSCQTYARFDSARMVYNNQRASVQARYNEPQLGGSSVLVQNGAQRPLRCWTSAGALAVEDSGWSNWLSGTDGQPESPATGEGVRTGALAAFEYGQTLGPGDSLVIVELFASCAHGLEDSLTTAIASRWKADIADYRAFIQTTAHAGLKTGLSDLDSSAVYARGIVEANRHWLNGAIVPMPCPAEYNFYFTHDVLLTDLGASMYDTGRVRDDLLYIAEHASADTIPHAYYWRDDGYKTELCTSDNWNHLWFILANGWYLRHTGDTATTRRMYPFARRSLEEILRQKRDDTLMYAFRPDWWDIGRKEGPRAFITILTIRALREFAAISSALQTGQDALLATHEALAAGMTSAMMSRLWDAGRGYLMNYNGQEMDTHYYMGSLLAAAFGLLPADTSRRMLATAARMLLAPQVGVRTVFPVDFHTDSMRAFFKFAGNEAGDPYLYANGGVWPHCNAWYAMGLQASGLQDSALEFYRNIMTVQGTSASPMGQPAMYEYRYSDPASSDYGRIDKPSFLWAGGFSLFTLYRLMGVRDNAWNVSLGHDVPSALRDLQFPLEFGNRLQVRQRGTGAFCRSVRIDGRNTPSRVLPEEARKARRVEIGLGEKPGAPCIEEVNARLLSVSTDPAQRSISAVLRSFKGMPVRLRFSSGRAPETVQLDGTQLPPGSFTRESPESEGTGLWRVAFTGTGTPQLLRISFR